MFQIKELTCEYRNNPIGLGERSPGISWKLMSDQRNVWQHSYQIQVSEDEGFSNIMWDSGEVVTDESNQIQMEELGLQSKKRYFYRVRVKNTVNEDSGWSAPHYWETGMFNETDWVAYWVAPPETINGEPCPVLKREFQLSGPVKSARIYATALGLYELKINGKKAGDEFFTPGWTNYRSRLQYQTYDVTHLLGQGKNKLTGVLGNGWYKGHFGLEDKRNLYGDRLALLAQLEVELENGETVIICTDDNWMVSKSPILMSEIYHGETYDARIEDHIQEWEKAEVLPYPKSTLVAQENVPVKKIDEIKPVRLIKTPKNETILDLGQNMVGWIRFSIKGEKGQQVEIQHAEILDQEGNFYSDNLRGARQTVRYTLKGQGQETYEPTFSFQGFRYILLKGFEREQINLDDFTGIVLHSDLAVTGDFKCSDPMINQLQHNILWGLKGNFLDVPTDCPQRDERLGWTGDAQIFIRTAAYLTNVAPFFKKWLRDLKSEQDPDGGVPFVVPNVLDRDGELFLEKPYSSAAWGDAAVICPWTVYICYDDKKLLEEQYESMKAWVEYIRKQGDNDYFWDTGFHFGDWVAIDAKEGTNIGATDRVYIATAFYAYSTSLVKKAAAVLGKSADADYFQDLETNIVQALTDEFITPNGRLAVDTQTGQVLGLMFNLLEGDAKDRAVEKLVALLEESDWHLTTGFVGTPYLNHVLSEHGHNETAYKLLFQKDYPSWLYQITKGATTIWENWDGIKENGEFVDPLMNSFNHYAYGAIGDWLYRKVAGIELHESHPGYKKFTVKPYIGEGIEWAEGQLETVHGLIRSFWKLEGDGQVTLEVTVPPNTSSVVTLPETPLNQVTLDGKPLESAAEGILSIESGEEVVKIEAGSGFYRFAYSC